MPPSSFRGRRNIEPSLIKVDDPESAVKESETLLGFPLRMAVPNIRLVRKMMDIPKDSLEKDLKDLLGPQVTGS